MVGLEVVHDKEVTINLCFNIIVSNRLLPSLLLLLSLLLLFVQTYVFYIFTWSPFYIVHVHRAIISYSIEHSWIFIQSIDMIILVQMFILLLSILLNLIFNRLSEVKHNFLLLTPPSYYCTLLCFMTSHVVLLVTYFI